MHNIDTIKQRLTSHEPVISESLAGDVLRDVDAILTPRRFNARVHCTKKSRCRAMFWGTLLGTSLGLLLGVTLTGIWFGHTGRQIVYVPVPVERPVEKPVETQKPQRPATHEREFGDLLIARKEPDSEIDRLIEMTLEQRRQIKIPESLGGQYDRHYAQHHVSAAVFQPDQSLMMLQRELLDAFQ